MAEHGAKFRKFDVAYFTASVDEPEKNKEFARSVGADYPILSDPGGEVAHAYGVTGADPEMGQPLDILHRRGRQDSLHRQGRTPGRLMPTTWRRSSRSWAWPSGRLDFLAAGS